MKRPRRRVRKAEEDMACDITGITPTLIVMLIMNIGWLMSVGFERQFLLGNHIVENYS